MNDRSEIFVYRSPPRQQRQLRPPTHQAPPLPARLGVGWFIFGVAAVISSLAGLALMATTGF